MSDFRKKMFRGAKVENAILQLERLKTQSQNRAERYATHAYLKNDPSSQYHEGVYQGVQEALDILCHAFQYPASDPPPRSPESPTFFTGGE